MVVINGKEYKLGMSLHVRLMYEQITGKIFGERMLEFDWIVLMYCVLLRFNKDFVGVELEKFVDMLAEDETPYHEFMKWHTQYWESRKALLEGANGRENGEGEKKN